MDKWRTEHTLELLGIIVASVAIIVAVISPEIRRRFGLDGQPDQERTPLATVPVEETVEGSDPLIGYPSEDKEIASDLIRKADEALDIGQYRVALNYFQEALEIERAVKDQEGELVALIGIGLAYGGLSEYDEALAGLQEALVLSLELENRTEEGRALGSIGNIYWAEEEYDIALSFLFRALVIVRETDNHEGQVSVINTIGLVYLERGQYDEALSSFIEALNIAREKGMLDAAGPILGNLGLVYSYQGDHELAKAAYEHALARARNSYDLHAEGTALIGLGTVSSDMQEYELAEDFLNQAVGIMKATGSREGESAALNARGVMFNVQGKYHLAKTDFEHALAVIENVESPGRLGDIQKNLGLVHHALDESYDAERYYQDSIRIAGNLGQREQEAQRRSYLGQLYLEQNKKDEGMEQLEAALAIARDLENSKLEDLILNCIEHCAASD